MGKLAFPILLVVLYIAAAGVYAHGGEWMKAGYFLSGGLITLFAALM